jgi:hypothetical protein
LKEHFDSAVVDVVDQCNCNRAAGTEQDRIAANSGSTRNSKEYHRNVRTGNTVYYVAQTALAKGGKITMKQEMREMKSELRNEIDGVRTEVGTLETSAKQVSIG